MKYSLMTFELTDDYINKVKTYLSDGLSNGTIIKIDDHYFDLKSLSILTNLDCLHCEEVCETNCCNGSPYPPQQESIDYVLSNHREIFLDEKVGTPEDRYYLYDMFLQRNKTVNFGNRRWMPGAIKKTKGMQTYPKVPHDRCVFNVEQEDGSHLCAIHGHCLHCNEDPIAKKPNYCSLYPLSSIDLDDTSKFIFCIIGKDITFNNWQGIDFSSRPCFNKGLLTDPNRQYFKDEDYKSAYESSYKSVVYLIGESTASKVLPYLHKYMQEHNIK